MAKKVERALISVSDKTGLVEFARGLSGLGITILSTGGTARALGEAGVPAMQVSDHTGFPEILDGRVKTLHPKIHGGLLGLRDNPAHRKQMAEHGIQPIDLVVVNLYPFELTARALATASDEGTTHEEVIEQIDIGGPSMVRSAAKNYQDVGIVTSPAQYDRVLAQLKDTGTLTSEFRLELAAEAFRLTSRYDAAIWAYLDGRRTKGPVEQPKELSLSYLKVRDLRYGENPHQAAALYRESVIAEPCAVAAEQLLGKELSFCNYLDLDAACELLKEFTECAAVVVKHTNPCGVAFGKDLKEAYTKARATDPVSAFGGIVALNRQVDVETAEVLNETFIEAIIAPGYNVDALELLKKKQQRRLMLLEGLETWAMVGGTVLPDRDVRKIVGGLLVQERDIARVTPQSVNVVTKRAPTGDEMRALMFAWKVCKHVKSNAIVYANATETIGIGAGQMSRVDSSRLAVMKAQKPLKPSVVASDAFFPFRDGVDAAIDAGATAIIQPGGSVRDEESIQACDERDVAMVFTGIRHFRHA